MATKIFISQGMRGLTDEEIIDARNEIIQYAESTYGDDIDIIDSYITDEEFEKGCKLFNINSAKLESAPDRCGLFMLGYSLMHLATADVAIFTDWENYRGCKIEHMCATEYGITTDRYFSQERTKDRDERLDKIIKRVDSLNSRA